MNVVAEACSVIMDRTVLTLTGSSPAVGSSSNTSVGLPISACAIDTRLAIP